MKIKNIAIFLCLIAAITLISCCHDSDNAEYPVPPTPTAKAKRTVIVYITADNNLASALQEDINEMVNGSKNLPKDCNLIAFIDQTGAKPYIAKISDGKQTKVKVFKNDFYSVSPDSMLSVYQWIIAKYPAYEYATIIEGHGSGPLISSKTVESGLLRLNAYGYDSTGEKASANTYKWMNITQMADVFSHLPHMAFMFFDCCCMQTVEVAYELRRYTDYILAPVSETPSTGAPYTNIIPLLGNPKDVVCTDIANHYIADTDFKSACGLCLSVVKTSELDGVLNATKQALATIPYDSKHLNLSVGHTIYYYRSAEETDNVPVLHDMKAVMLHNLSPEAFQAWVPYLEKAVTAKHMPQPQGEKALWLTNPWGPNINFYTFIDHFDEDHYGGISMIVPNDNYEPLHPSVGQAASVNKLMFQLEWANDIGWKDLGW